MFVANRIEMTKDYTDSHQWHYIGSKDNPADYSSRGIDEANEKAKYHLLCGNQKHSEPFKTTKHFTGWSINKKMSSDQLHFNWKGPPGSS